MSKTAEEVAAKLQEPMTRLRVLYDRIASHYSLTPAQMTIMEFLYKNGASRISAVSEAEGIRMPTASNALVQLERRELIRRVRDSVDRRGVKVALTNLGKTEYEEAREARRKTLAQLLDHLDEATLANAYELADVIVELAERYTPAKHNANN